jgi:hypothetical protein
MTRLPKDLAAFGLRVETVPGWDTRGSSSFAPAGVVCHWTAGPAKTTKRPSLNVVLNGRPGLSGPLCNVYLARDGACVVVAAGRANHAGTGSWKHLIGNSAVYGIEAEAAGPKDWTEAQREAYPRLVAAMLNGLKRDASYACGHSEWAGPRKQDIDGWPMTQMRADIKAVLINPNASKGETRPATTVQEDDVQLTDSIPNANPDTRSSKPQVSVSDVWQDVQANAAFAARNTAGLAALDRDLRADLSAKGRTIEALIALVAQQNGLSLDDVRRVLAEELTKGIDVQVSVSPSALTSSGE